jgi:hypothetical protein
MDLHEQTTALWNAVENGDSASLERNLKSYDAKLVSAFLESPQDDFTPLMTAARAGDFAVVKILLTAGANPNTRIEGKSALCEAISYSRNLKIAEALVEAGADLKTDYFGETLLMSAAEACALDIVKWLLDRGADPHAHHPQRGMTALDFAKVGKNPPIIDLLQALGVEELRARPRALANFLARQFKSKAIAHSHGFMMNCRFENSKCQLHFDSRQAGIAVHELTFLAPELRGADAFALRFGENEPKAKGAQVVEEPGLSKLVGVKVWRTTKSPAITKEFAERFCNEFQTPLKALRISGAESLRIGANSMSLFWTGFDTALALEKMNAFGALLKAISRAPQPPRQLFEKEWLLKSAPKSSKEKSHHSFGGKFGESIPCPHCGTATNLMAQLDLADPALPQMQFAVRTLPLFWCLACTEWQPSFYALAEGKPIALDSKGIAIKSNSLQPGEDDLPARAAILSPVASATKARRKSKVGGKPDWIQTDASPDCPRCREAMAFVAQLASDKHISYDDLGMLYAFACEPCKIVATLIQSH